MEVHFIYTYEDSIMEPNKNCWKKAGGREAMGI
jgi:hypothetical protein